MFAAKVRLAGDKDAAAHSVDQAATTARESDVTAALKATVASLETACGQEDEEVACLRAHSVQVIHAVVQARSSAAAAKERAETAAVVVQEVNRLTQELKSQRAAAVEQHAKVVELEGKVACMAAALQEQVECKAALRSMQEQHQSLLFKMEKVDAAAESVEEALATEKVKHATTIRAHARLEEKLVSRDEEREQLFERLAASTAEANSARAEVASASAAAQKVMIGAADEASRQVKTSLEDLRAAQVQIKEREEKASRLEKQVETSASDCASLQSQLEGKNRMLSNLKVQMKSQVESAKAMIVEEFEAGLGAVQRKALAEVESYKARFDKMKTQLCDAVGKLATAKLQGKWTRGEKREAKARKREEREAVEAARRPSANADVSAERTGSTATSVVSLPTPASVDEKHGGDINTSAMAAIAKRRRRRRRQQQQQQL